MAWGIVDVLIVSGHGGSEVLSWRWRGYEREVWVVEDTHTRHGVMSGSWRVNEGEVWVVENIHSWHCLSESVMSSWCWRLGEWETWLVEWLHGLSEVAAPVAH